MRYKHRPAAHGVNGRKLLVCACGERLKWQQLAKLQCLSLPKPRPYTNTKLFISLACYSRRRNLDKVSFARVVSAAVHVASRQRLPIALRSIPYIAIFVSFGVMLVISWNRWLSPLTDSGREMDLPLRLLNGELLYRDIHYLYPPFSPYFNALLYRVFGVQLGVLQAGGIIGAAIVVFLCFRIARRLFTPLDASIAALTVIVWLVFKPNGNLISPYAYAALHATIFALGALLCSLRFAENKRIGGLIAAGALTGLAAIAKLEFALPAAAAIITALLCVHRGEYRRLAVSAAAAAIPIAAIVLSVYGWFLYRVGWQTLVIDCHLFYTHLPGSLVVYNAWRSGTDRPFESLAEMFGGAAVCALIASGVLIASVIRAKGRVKTDPGAQRSRRILTRATIVVILSAAAISLIIETTGGWDGSPLRAAPVLLLGVIIGEWWRGKTSEQNAALLIIALYSIVILSRVALRVPSGGHYGSFFLPTTYLLFCYLGLRALPRAIERWTLDEQSSSYAQSIARGLIVLALLVGAAGTTIRYRTRYRYLVQAPRGSLRVVRAHYPAYQEALDFLRDHSAAGDAIAVFPEGSDLAFLSERRMPLRHQILLPGLMSQADEQRAIIQFASEPIRYVLIVNRPTREFGAEVFGGDFYQELGEAISKEYHVVQVCGRDRNPQIEIGDPEFFIKILARNR